MAHVFLSYRIADSAAHAGRLADALRAYFGRNSVFLSADNMAQGAAWRNELVNQLRDCSVVLAIVGPTWTKVPGADGTPRLLNQDDIVRMEIREALALGRPVVPVMVGGAQLPALSDLPADISSLLSRSVAEVRDNHWESDVEHLAKGIGGVVLALRIRNWSRVLASTRRAFAILGGLLILVFAAQMVLVRLDVLDAYSLRILPYLLALVTAVVLMVHFASARSLR
jgi:hypothetical protein